MRFNRVALFIGFALSLGAASLARAQSKDEPAKLSDAEVQVLARLHHVNQMEIELAKVAASQAKSPEVKKYAERLLKDHTKADNKVNDLAKKRGVTLTHPTPKDDAEKKQMDEEMATMTRLKGLEGETFDREYVTAMASGHGRVLKMVSDAQSQAKDPEVISILKSVHPVVQQHLKTAEKLAAKLNKSSTPGETPTK